MKLLLSALGSVFLLSLVTLFIPAVCSADTVYTTFGPGQTFNMDGGSLVGQNNFPPPPSQGIAAAFTPNETVTLTQIDVGVSAVPAAGGLVVGSHEILMELLSGVGGSPGSLVESWTLTNLPTLGTSFPPESVTAALSVTLFAGTEYWLALLPDLGTNVWNGETATVGTLRLTNDGGASWNAPILTGQPAFDVQGSPVRAAPEPSSLLLLGSGLVLLARRKFAREH